MKKFLRTIAVTLTLLLLCSMVTVAATQPQVSVGDSKGNAGEYVLVPVRISGNTDGLAGWQLTLSYDKNVLTPVDVVAGDLTAGDLQHTYGGAEFVPGEWMFNWSSAEGNVSFNGVLFYAKFLINETATGSATVSLSYDAESTFRLDSSWNFIDVALQCNSGTITISSKYDAVPKISLTANSVTAGQTAQIQASISTVGSFAEADFVFDFDSSALVFDSMSVDASLSASATVEGNTLRIHIQGLSKSVEGKQFLTVYFASRVYADSGEYPITLTVQNAVGTSEVLISNCAVTIEPSASGDAARIQSNPNLSGRQNDIIQVPVYIYNNKGLAAYKIILEYDESKLKPISATNTGLFAGTFLNNISVETREPGSCFVSWYHHTQTEANGELFYISFQVLSSAAETADIRISYSQEDTIDIEGNDVAFLCENTAVTLNPEWLIGDVNFDGFVNLTDYSLLCSACVGAISLSADAKSAGDLNGDGAVDAFDAAALNMLLNIA